MVHPTKEDQRLQQWQDDNRERLEAQWLGSRLRQQILDEHGGTLPTELAFWHPTQNAVYALPESWHSLIYADHVMNRRRGHCFTVADCYSTLGRYRVEMHDDKNRRSIAVVGFLKHLERQGVLSIRQKNGWLEGLTVLRTIKEKMAAQAQAEHQRMLEARARVAAEEARIRKAQEDRERLARLAEAGASATVATSEPARTGGTQQELGAAGRAVVPYEDSTKYRCRKCRLPLDPILAKRGYHTGCG